MTDDRLSAMARRVIDANVYLTLATADVADSSVGTMTVRISRLTKL